VSTGMEQLPNEVFFHLLSFLGLRDLAACSLVSKGWHSLANDGAIWRTLTLSRAGGATHSPANLSLAQQHGWKHTFMHLEKSAHHQECKECFRHPIDGPMFACWHCLDFHLCQICESEKGHDPSHVLLKIPHNKSQPPKWRLVPILTHGLPCRSCGTLINGHCYRCRDCQEYNLCATCMENREHTGSTAISREHHDPSHSFVCIATPGVMVQESRQNYTFCLDCNKRIPRQESYTCWTCFSAYLPRPKWCPAPVHIFCVDCCSKYAKAGPNDIREKKREPENEKEADEMALKDVDHFNHVFLRTSSSEEHNVCYCNICFRPPYGVRYRCAVCFDFDICELCEKVFSLKHHGGRHPFMKLLSQGSFLNWAKKHKLLVLLMSLCMYKQCATT